METCPGEVADAASGPPDTKSAWLASLPPSGMLLLGCFECYHYYINLPIYHHFVFTTEICPWLTV